MKKTTTTIVQINTSAQLLNTYELLAITVKKKFYQLDLSDPTAERTVIKINDDALIGTNLTLINLNAAIIEGTLRALFSDIIQTDSNTLGELSIECEKNKAYGTLTRSYGVLNRFKDEVELKGGWESIKRQYKEYLGIDIDKLCTAEQKSALDSIFVMRNAAAHGTSFTIPKIQMKQEDKDLYPYKWQNKLHGMNMYLKRNFDQDFFACLRDPAFAEHFMVVTQTIFSEIEKLEVFNSESRFHFENIRCYVFGKDVSFLRKYRKENSASKD